MRRRASLRILQRRAVAQPDQREELIQLAVAVDRQRPAAQVERDRVLGDDWREDEPTLPLWREINANKICGRIAPQ